MADKTKDKTAAPGAVPRLADVAQKVGVSPGLVSRILNNDPRLYIRDETRERVLAAVHELGYTPNSAARALRQARAGALGLVVHRISNPIYGEIIAGAQRAAAENGFVIMLGNAIGPSGDTRELTSILGSGRIDGFILQHGYGALDVALDQLPSSVPTVLFNSAGQAGFTGVRLQDEAATSMLVAHLAEQGHQRIGFIGGERSGLLSLRREEGFRAGMAEAGLMVREDWVVGNGWEAENGQAAFTSLLSATTDRPTAVVVINANVALGVLTSARKAGIAVPEQMSVCAVHDAWFTEHSVPPLTCVQLPLGELGRRATLKLIDILKNGTDGDVLVADPAPQLVVRESTAPPRYT